MKTGILLSVREKATRLPGKVLLPFGNCNVTEHLIQQLKTSEQADRIIVSTSTDPRDEVLVKTAKSMGVDYFKGSKDDKLLRYLDTAKEFDLDFIVIVDGDDPFCSVEHIDQMIQRVKEDNADYIIWEGLPLGATGFGVKVSALENVCHEKTIANTEIWGHFFTENKNIESVTLKEENPLYNRPDIRMTLDYQEDYDFFQEIIKNLTKEEIIVNFQNAMQFLKDKPQVSEINKKVQDKYEKHLQRSLGA